MHCLQKILLRFQMELQTDKFFRGMEPVGFLHQFVLYLHNIIVMQMEMDMVMQL
jgi:hypothetical protein